MNITVTRNGANLPLKEIDSGLLMEFWEVYMKSNGPDICRISVFKSSSDEEEVQHCMLPPTFKLNNEAKRALLAKLDKLGAKMRQYYPEAAKKVKQTFDFYDHKDKTDAFVILYGKCKDGIIAIGWANDGDMHKAKTMAAFAMFSLAQINALQDKILYDAGACRLPYRDSRLDIDLCERLFAKHKLGITP